MSVIFTILLMALTALIVSLIGKTNLDRPAFAIGSRGYGYRTDNSDLDIVLFVDENLAKTLESFAKIERVSTQIVECKNEYGTWILQGKGKRIKIGQLDLIFTTDKKTYDMWKSVDSELRSRKKTMNLTRENVVDISTKMRNDVIKIHLQ